VIIPENVPCEGVYFLNEEQQTAVIAYSPGDKVEFGEQKKLLPSFFLQIFTQ